MQRSPQVLALGLLLSTVLSAAEPSTAPAAAASPSAIEERAITLYDQARFAEARPLFEQLDAGGTASGAVLYRLAFCQRQAKDPAASTTEQRAMERLERELSSARDLETPFYLVNAYQNQGRKDRSTQVAAETTERVQRGEIPTPASGVDQFRMAKLLADQGNDADAATWYRKAIEAFSAEAEPSRVSYFRWANRFLAERAVRAGDMAEAETRLAALTAQDPELADLDRLAGIRVRLGRYAEAAGAWQQIERLRPAEADRARYCAQLALRAVALGRLPERDARDRAWKDLNQADLESALLAEAQAAKDLIAQASPELEPELRKELEGRLLLAKGRFVAAGLEYAVRGLPIRETAFRAGYATSIFHDSAWQLPPPG